MLHLLNQNKNDTPGSATTTTTDVAYYWLAPLSFGHL